MTGRRVILFNSYLQRHRHNLLRVPELAPDLIAARLRKRVDEANIWAVENTGVQHALGCHWLDRVDMRKDRAVGAARDHMAGHTKPRLHIGDRHASIAEVERECSLLTSLQSCQR